MLLRMTQERGKIEVPETGVEGGQKIFINHLKNKPCVNAVIEKKRGLGSRWKNILKGKENCS